MNKEEVAYFFTLVQLINLKPTGILIWIFTRLVIQCLIPYFKAVMIMNKHTSNGFYYLGKLRIGNEIT